MEDLYMHSSQRRPCLLRKEACSHVLIWSTSAHGKSDYHSCEAPVDVIYLPSYEHYHKIDTIHKHLVLGDLRYIICSIFPFLPRDSLGILEYARWWWSIATKCTIVLAINKHIMHSYTRVRWPIRAILTHVTKACEKKRFRVVVVAFRTTMTTRNSHHFLKAKVTRHSVKFVLRLGHSIDKKFIITTYRCYKIIYIIKHVHLHIVLRQPS